MKILPIAFGVAALTLAACADQTPLEQAVSGKSFIAPNGEFKAKDNGELVGTVGGEELLGAWEDRDGRWCRTITTPVTIAGTHCSDVVIVDKEIQLTNHEGHPVLVELQ